MNIALFLAIGESFNDFKKKGQLKRLLDYNVQKYAENFDHVYIFSYENEGCSLPANCTLVPNKWNIHRYLYAIMLPFLNFKIIKNCQIVRGLQLTGGIPALICKALTNKKYVINYGYDYSQFAKIEGKKFQQMMFSVIEWPIIHFADHVIVMSTALKKSVAKYMQQDKITILPNGVDLTLFKPSKIKSNHKPKALSILFVGRLEKQKNLSNLIYGAAKAAIPTRVTFVGSGSQKQYLQRLAHKVKVNLKIRIPIEYSQVPKTINQHDIFALVSIKEGSPKILLEAMACGSAIMGSNIKEITNLIQNEKTGVITETDPGNIAKAIIKLNNFSFRKRLGARARTIAVQNYDIHRLLKLEVSILKHVAKTG